MVAKNIKSGSKNFDLQFLSDIVCRLTFFNWSNVTFDKIKYGMHIFFLDPLITVILSHSKLSKVKKV